MGSLTSFYSAQAGPAHLVSLKREAAGQHLDAGIQGLTKQLSVTRISAVARCKRRHIRSAQAGHQHCSGLWYDIHQFLQVLLPPFGDRIGEQRQ